VLGAVRALVKVLSKPRLTTKSIFGFTVDNGDF
jgi:hypothetical protein